MSVQFVSNIKWPENPLLMVPQFYGVRVPPGLNEAYVHEPKFVNVPEMNRLSRSRVGAGGQLRMVGGLVTQELEVRFHNIETQWRCTPMANSASNHGPARFEFQGGEVILDLSLGIYILNMYRPGRDAISEEIFAVIYGHELLHVMDEVNIFKQWLPPRLPTEPTLARYLVRAEPLVYGTPAQPINQVEQAFHVHIQNRLQNYVHSLWAVEVNRRQALRDSPTEYRLLQDRIDALRRRQING